MIERYSDVQKRNKKFQLNLLAQVSAGIFRESAKEALGSYEYHQDSVKELFSEYLSAPKQLGAFDDESLTIIAVRAMSFSEVNAPPAAIRSQMIELGATAMWEAAFVQTRAAHNSIDSVDERLEYIDGYKLLNTAAQSLRENDSVDFHRLELRNSFTWVLKDIVCGDISPETIEEIRQHLADRLNDAQRIKDKGDAEGYVGEIKVLQYYWDRYKKIGDLVAVPSTVRGGSGHFRPEETHDIDLLKQRKDKSWILAPTVEVKKRQIQEAELQRYIRSLLAYVAPDGTVSFTSSHRIRPEIQGDIAS